MDCRFANAAELQATIISKVENYAPKRTAKSTALDAKAGLARKQTAAMKKALQLLDM